MKRAAAERSGSSSCGSSWRPGQHRLLHGNTLLILAALVLLQRLVVFVGLPDGSDAAVGPLELSRRFRAKHEEFVSKLHRWDAHLPGGDAPRSAPAPVAVDAKPELLVLSSDPAAQERVLVVYTYAHADWRLLNLEFFLRHGLVAETQGKAPVDFTFVFNGEAPLAALESLDLRYSLVNTLATLASDNGTKPHSSLQQRAQPLITVVLRENFGFDMCGSKLVLERGWAPRPGSYTRVILMNASVRGPFMPSYASSAFSWIDAFLSRLGGAGGAHMVGTTVNCFPSRRNKISGAFSSLHLQSMVLAFDPAALRAAHSVLRCYDDMLEAISHGEIGSTQAVLAAGLAVTALQGNWRDLVVRAENLASDEVARRCAAVSDDAGGDPSTPGAYLQGDLHPYEVIFIKTNRLLNASVLERFTRLHDSF